MKPGFFILFYGISFLVGCGMLVSGSLADLAALTDDGYNLKPFF